MDKGLFVQMTVIWFAL